MYVNWALELDVFKTSLNNLLYSVASCKLLKLHKAQFSYLQTGDNYMMPCSVCSL